MACLSNFSWVQMYSEHCEENFYLAQELKCIFKNERVNSSHIFGKHNIYIINIFYRRATSLELPMAMRFRHLEKTSKEAVGVYRSAVF